MERSLAIPPTNQYPHPQSTTPPHPQCEKTHGRSCTMDLSLERLEMFRQLSQTSRNLFWKMAIALLARDFAAALVGTDAGSCLDHKDELSFSTEMNPPDITKENPTFPSVCCAEPSASACATKPAHPRSILIPWRNHNSSWLIINNKVVADR